MKKLYDDKMYADMAVQANTEGKKLIKVQEEREYEVEVLEWDYIEVEEERQKIDPETGEPMYDDEGNPIMEIVTVQKAVPHMVEETIINPETGEEKTIIVQGHHTETRTEIVEYLEIVDNPENFERCFFETSLGYVKRKAFVKGTGEFKDFLDMSTGMEEGQKILVYDKDLNQSIAFVTDEFKEECAAQYNADFYGQSRGK